MNIVFFISLSLFSSLKTSYSHEFVCNNTDIRNYVNVNKLINCTQIEGYLRIVLIDKESSDRFKSISFPRLKVITDYLLLFRVSKLTTLSNLFPNLISIHGIHLFYDYAFVINNLPDLQTIGLNNIKHIKGGVRFEKNPNLCFANTKDYELISNAVKSTHSNPRPKSLFNTSITIKPKSDHEIAFKWNSTLSENYNITKYIITLTEIEDSNDYNNQLNYCNNSLPFERREYNCENRNKPYSFIFNTAEHEFQNQSVFSTFFHKTNIYVEKSGVQSDEIKSKTSVNITKFSTVYHIKKVCFKETVKATNNTGFTLSKLKHFTPYILKVEACDDIQCHILDIKKIKTLGIKNADNINETSIRHSVNNNSVLIKWEEPKDPNGIILRYDIKYQQISKNNTTKINSVCVDPYDYLKNKSYRINGLNYNTNYSYKLRANTMSGPGNWSLYHDFRIDDVLYDETLESKEKDDSPRFVYYIIIPIIITIGFILIAILCYLKSPAKEKLNCDVISINPEYEKFIVDNEWEIPKRNIRIYPQQILGDGYFGLVYLGEITANQNTVKCAVKTLKTTARTLERENFLKEAHIMKSFVDCHHIVKLMGIFSVENPVLVLMEFMANGDLRKYLRSKRPNDSGNPKARNPSLSRIMQMAIEISDGMSYLAHRRFVHRDLAARNCMVSNDLTVKIGDFGMTRDVYDSDYYRKNDRGLIPVRWMAPESLRDGLFTSYSDIWSYGVVLYEMVTLGTKPYQGLSNENVYKYVISGGLMKEPDNCPKIIWRIISECWRKNPKNRPTFSQIVEKLMPSAHQRFREVCFHLNHKQMTCKTFWDNLSAPLKQMNHILNNRENKIDNYNEDNNELSYFPMNLINKVKNCENNKNRHKRLNQMNEIQNFINIEEKETQVIANEEKKLIEDEVISKL